jgi:hypothetical protein
MHLLHSQSNKVKVGATIAKTIGFGCLMHLPFMALSKKNSQTESSLMLRAFLIGNPEFKVIAFNSYVGYSMPEIFQSQFPGFLDGTGGSFWIRKIF